MPTIGYVRNAQGQVVYKVDLPEDNDFPKLLPGETWTPCAAEALEGIEIYEAPPFDWRKEYGEALTTGDKINVIAKLLNLQD